MARAALHAALCLSISSKIGSAAAGAGSLSALASAGAIGVAAAAAAERREAWGAAGARRAGIVVGRSVACDMTNLMFAG